MNSRRSCPGSPGKTPKQKPRRRQASAPVRSAAASAGAGTSAHGSRSPVRSMTRSSSMGSTSAPGAAGVIGYQWCDTEKRPAWEALLQRFPAPAVVVTDGGTGLISARKHAWPQTRVQRCLVHIQRNVRTHLTTRPRTLPGKELRQLSLALTRITTTAQATSWLQALGEFHQRHRGFIYARTYRGQHPGPVPGWVRPGQKSWFTHDRLRKAYSLLERCAKLHLPGTGVRLRGRLHDQQNRRRNQRPAATATTPSPWHP